MLATDECTKLTPDERRAELASIFAAGILRLRLRAATPADDSGPEKPAESGAPTP